MTALNTGQVVELFYGGWLPFDEGSPQVRVIVIRHAAPPPGKKVTVGKRVGEWVYELFITTLPKAKPPPRPPRAVRSRHRWSWQDRLACNAGLGPPQVRLSVAVVPAFLTSNYSRRNGQHKKRLSRGSIAL